MSAKIRIVIADDHPIVRQGLATVLDQEDDMVVAGQARNGLEAVSLARSLRPDVILMDLQMPEMNGIDATKRIIDVSPETGVIILTTFDTDEYIFGGIEAGARAYLLKDSPPEEVIEAVRAVHRGESMMGPRIARRVMDRVGQISRAPEPGPVVTPREIEVLKLLATGAGNKEIAALLHIGESTVKTHAIRIFSKLGVSGRTEAVAEAARRGIIQL